VCSPSMASAEGEFAAPLTTTSDRHLYTEALFLQYPIYGGSHILIYALTDCAMVPLRASIGIGSAPHFLLGTVLYRPSVTILQRNGDVPAPWK
jgi:hypothetical protein